MKQWQRYLAELFGTFILVFGGTTAILSAAKFGGGGFTLFIAPFGFGLALMAALYAFAEVSGGHFNPAVSLGLFLVGRGRYRWGILALGALGTALIIQLPVFRVILLRFTVASQSFSYYARLVHWKLALHRFLTHPLRRDSVQRLVGEPCPLARPRPRRRAVDSVLDLRHRPCGGRDHRVDHLHGRDQGRHGPARRHAANPCRRPASKHAGDRHAATDRIALQRLMLYERAATLRDKVKRLEQLRQQFDRLHFAVESLSFVYNVAGYEGDDRVYLIRRGRVRATLRRIERRVPLQLGRAELFHLAVFSRQSLIRRPRHLRTHQVPRILRVRPRGSGLVARLPAHRRAFHAHHE